MVVMILVYYFVLHVRGYTAFLSSCYWRSCGVSLKLTMVLQVEVEDISGGCGSMYKVGI